MVCNLKTKTQNHKEIYISKFNNSTTGSLDRKVVKTRLFVTLTIFVKSLVTCMLFNHITTRFYLKRSKTDQKRLKTLTFTTTKHHI